MSNAIPDDRKRAIVQELAAENQSLSETTLRSEWDQWLSKHSNSAELSTASVSDLKQWFVKHLHSAGITSARKDARRSSGLRQSVDGIQRQRRIQDSRSGLAHSGAEEETMSGKAVDAFLDQLDAETSWPLTSRGEPSKRRGNAAFRRLTSEGRSDSSRSRQSRVTLEDMKHAEHSALNSNRGNQEDLGRKGRVTQALIPEETLRDADKIVMDQLMERAFGEERSYEASGGGWRYHHGRDRYDDREADMFRDDDDDRYDDDYYDDYDDDGYYDDDYFQGVDAEFAEVMNDNPNDYVKIVASAFPQAKIEFRKEDRHNGAQEDPLATLVGAELAKLKSEPLKSGIRMKQRVIGYALAKAIAHWSSRHRDSDPDDVVDTGLLIGAAMAQKVFQLNSKQGNRRRRPISATDIKNRHGAIIYTHVLGIVRAGDTSDSAYDYSSSVLLTLHEDIQEFGQAFVPRSRAQLDIDAAFPEKAKGRLMQRMRSLYRGTKGKIRALVNEAEMQLIVRATLRIANTVIPKPDEPRGIEGWGIDAETGVAVRGFAKKLHHELTISQKGGRRSDRLARNENTTYTAMNLMQGILFGFITNRRLQPYAADLAGAADNRIEQLRPDLFAENNNNNGGNNGDQLGLERPLPDTPDAGSSAPLHNLLITKARAYLARHPDLVRATGKRYAMLIPADPICVKQVREKLKQDPEAYVRGALLARHPNKAQDEAGHLISLAGQIFYLGKLQEETGKTKVPGVAAASAAVRSSGRSENVGSGSNSDLQLRFMRRESATRAHHAPISEASISLPVNWEQERVDQGGKLLPRTDMLPLDCVSGKAVAFTMRGDSGQKALVRPLFYYRHE